MREGHGKNLPEPPSHEAVPPWRRRVALGHQRGPGGKLLGMDLLGLLGWGEAMDDESYFLEATGEPFFSPQ